MPKGTLVRDTFEQLAELGKSTAKKGAKQIGQTLNPLVALDSSTEDSKDGKTTKSKTEKGKNKNSDHTPLDFDKLQKNYDNQDDIKLKKLRQHLFQLGKQGEQKLILEEEKEEEEKKRKEAYEQQDKRRKEEENRRLQQQQETPLPRGKKRRSIFSPKKVAEREHAEYKPSSGKQ